MRRMTMRSAFLALALLACCGGGWADQSPPPSIGPFQPQVTGIRPVVAAGLHYIYALNASYFEVYRRNPDGTPGPLAMRQTALATIFAPVIAKLNATITYPASSGITPCPAALAGQAYNPPAQGMPFANAACIEGAYDSDVYYDPQTKRFWILAHLRPSIWQCLDGRQGIYTPADSRDGCRLLAADVLAKTLHRFIAVAVSRPGASDDVEDPSNGFNTYILADIFGDWTQLMVHNGWVLVNARDLRTNNRLDVFSASDLMTNRVTPDKAVLPKPLATFDNGKFNGPAFDSVGSKTIDVKLTTAMMFVRQQSDDAVTYLLSGTADGHMVVYGLVSKPGSETPNLIMPGVVSLPERMPSLQTASGAYINGFLFWGWGVADPRDRSRSFIRTFRWELHQLSHTWNNIHPIFITNVKGSGYLEADIGKADPSLSYVLPTLNAAPNGDVVTMFHTYPAKQAPKGPYQASVQYAVLRKGQSIYDSPYLLEAGQGLAPAPPHQGGVLDIVSVAADPLVPGQYFLGSAFTDAKGGWLHVIAAVKP
jgi:hypothetical protein